MDEVDPISKNLKVALGLSSLGSLFIFISFFSPYWLQSVPTERIPNPKFKNLGLWEVCFDGFHDMRHQYDTRFYGCKHILLEEYAIIQNEIQPPFFVATQFFFTLCFTTMLLAIVLVLIYLLCIDDYYRVRMLRWTGFDLILSGALGTIALIVFGIYGDARDYMPDWENNYISWSFGLGFVGVVLEFIGGVLFMVEARIMLRKEIAREQQYPMEKRV